MTTKCRDSSLGSRRGLMWLLLVLVGFRLPVLSVGAVTKVDRTAVDKLVLFGSS